MSLDRRGNSLTTGLCAEVAEAYEAFDRTALFDRGLATWLVKYWDFIGILP